MREEGSLIFLFFFFCFGCLSVFTSQVYVASTQRQTMYVRRLNRGGRVPRCRLRAKLWLRRWWLLETRKRREPRDRGRGGEEARGAAAGVGGRVARHHRISTRLKIKSKPKNDSGVVTESTDSSRRCVSMKLRLNPIFALRLSPCFAPSRLGVGCPHSCTDEGLWWRVGAK